MFRLRKTTKYVIIILLIIFAGSVAAKFSKIETIFDSGKKEVITEDKEAIRIFESLNNDKKIKMMYSVTDLSEFTKNLNDIYSEYQISPHYSNTASTSYVTIFDYPKTKSEEIMNKLRGLQKLTNEFMESADPNKYKINIDDHIVNKERVKSTIEKKIDSSIIITEDRISQYNNQLTNIQMQIDSLRNQKSIIANLSANNVVYILANYIPETGANVLRTKRLNMVKNFLFYFFGVLVAGIIALILINYFFILILNLMRLLGIKTARSSSGGYKYGYSSNKSYHSRGYYSRPQKKVKRIYKDADGNVIKQKVSKE